MTTTLRTKVWFAIVVWSVACAFISLPSPRTAMATKTGSVQDADCIDSACSNCYVIQTVAGGVLTSCMAMDSSSTSTTIKTCHTGSNQGCFMTNNPITNCGGTLSAYTCPSVGNACGPCSCAGVPVGVGGQSTYDCI